MKTKISNYSGMLKDVPAKLCMFPLMLLASLFANSSTAFAKEDYAFLKNGGTMFNGVKDTVNKTTQSGIKFMTVLGYVCVFCLIVSIGIGFIVWRNPQETAQNKKKILIVVLAAVLIFGAGSVASIVAGIGDSL